ncbi:MAG: aminotransferase class V-fold PLP-dependent enzyme [Candidatus Margulisbacteria bacterium]|jgi:selenocysteine lyase/cysteine desulfurase|nr:aminotransferase class V-fold PLP-dependent enzyme [Candidatus Margulisiibacteriota bacterium]
MLSKIVAEQKSLLAELRGRTDRTAAGKAAVPPALNALDDAEASLETRLEFLRGQLLGNEAEELTVFGHIRQLYADYTAQGKQLEFLVEYEKWFSRRFGNTHTADTLTADFSHTAFNRAITIIHNALRAAKENYVALPVGQGTSGAIERLHKILGIDVAPATLQRISRANQEKLLELQNIKDTLAAQKTEWAERLAKTTDKKFREFLAGEIEKLDRNISALDVKIEEWGREFIPASERPVVLITCQEHHGNTLPYDGTLADKHIVPFVPGTVDLDTQKFEAKLRELQAQGRQIIVSLSAASNVTGHKTDIAGTAALAKKYGALTIYDHASSLAYEPVDLSLRTEDGQPLIDAVVASPHKLPGGPGSTGLLVFNKAIYPVNAKGDLLDPTNKAGGTVWHVSLWDVEYSKDILERELSGTPNGVGLLRLALAIDLAYNVIGFENIARLETKLAAPLFERLQSDPNIILYGDQELDKRIPIFSFNVRHGGGILHPKFVARILSDLFGIQTRPGCSCAGEYGHYLLEITEEHSRVMLGRVREGVFAGKPGWVRLNPHWLFSPQQVDYIVEALKLIAEHGYKLLSLYELDLNGEYLFKKELKPADYTDVNVADANSISVAHAFYIYRQEQTAAPKESKYAYQKALLNQLENAEFFLKSLPDNSAQLKALQTDQGAPLPLLYVHGTPKFNDFLKKAELEQKRRAAALEKQEGQPWGI